LLPHDLPSANMPAPPGVLRHAFLMGRCPLLLCPDGHSEGLEVGFGPGVDEEVAVGVPGLLVAAGNLGEVSQ